MTIKTEDGKTIIEADEGKAICRAGEGPVSHTVRYEFPEGREDPRNWQDCELGEPEVQEEATESDYQEALSKLGVDLSEKRGE